MLLNSEGHATSDSTFNVDKQLAKLNHDPPRHKTMTHTIA